MMENIPASHRHSFLAEQHRKLLDSASDAGSSSIGRALTGKQDISLSLLDFLGFCSPWDKPDRRLYFPRPVEHPSDGSVASSLSAFLIQSAASSDQERQGVLLRGQPGTGTTTAMRHAYFDCLLPEVGADAPVAENESPCWLDAPTLHRDAIISLKTDLEKHGLHQAKENDHAFESIYLAYALIGLSTGLLKVGATIETAIKADDNAVDTLQRIKFYCDYSDSVTIFCDLKEFDRSIRDDVLVSLTRFQQAYKSKHRIVISIGMIDQNPKSDVFTELAIRGFSQSDSARYLENLGRVWEQMLPSKHAQGLKPLNSLQNLTASQLTYHAELLRNYSHLLVPTENSIDAMTTWCRALIVQPINDHYSDIDRLLVLSQYFGDEPMPVTADSGLEPGRSEGQPTFGSWLFGKTLVRLLQAETVSSPNSIRSSSILIPDSARDNETDNSLRGICEEILVCRPTDLKRVTVCQGALVNWLALRSASGPRSSNENRAKRIEAKMLQDNADLCRQAKFRSGEAVFLAEASKRLSAMESLRLSGRIVEALENALVPDHFSSRRVFLECAVWHPEGRVFATADRADGFIRVWEIETGDMLSMFEAHKVPLDRPGSLGTIRGLVFDPMNPDHLISCGLDGSLKRWGWKTGREIGSIPSSIQQQPIWTAMEYHRVQGNLVLVDYAGLVSSFDIARFRLRHTTQLNGTGFRCVACSNTGRIAVGDSEGHVYLLDAELRAYAVLKLSSFSRDSQIRALAFCPIGDRLAVGGQSGRIEVYDIKSREMIVSLLGHARQDGNECITTCLRWHKDYGLVSSGSNGMVVVHGDVRASAEPQGRMEYDLKIGTNRTGLQAIRSIDIENTRNQLLVVGCDNTFHIYDVIINQAIAVLEGADCSIAGAKSQADMLGAISADRSVVCMSSASTDAYLRTYSPYDLNEQTRFEDLTELEGTNDTYPIHALSLSPNGDRVAIANHLGWVTVRDCTNGKLIWQRQLHRVFLPPDFVENGQESAFPNMTTVALHWSDDGARVYALGCDSCLITVNAVNGETIRLFNLENSGTRFLQLYERVLGVDHNNFEYKPVSIIGGDEQVFEIDQNTIVTAGRDGSVRKWNSDSGSLISQYSVPGRSVISIALSEDKSLIAIADKFGVIEVLLTSDFEPIARVSIPELCIGFASDSKEPMAFEMQNIRGLAVSSRNRSLAAAHADGTIIVCSIDQSLVIARGRGIDSRGHWTRHSLPEYDSFGNLITLDSDRIARKWTIGVTGQSCLMSYNGSVSAILALSDGSWAGVVNGTVDRNLADETVEKAIWSLEFDAIWEVSEYDGVSLLVTTSFGRIFHLDQYLKPSELLPTDLERKFPDAEFADRFRQAVDDPNLLEELWDEFPLIRPTTSACSTLNLIASTWKDGRIDLWEYRTLNWITQIKLPYPIGEAKNRYESDRLALGVHYQPIVTLAFSKQMQSLIIATSFGEILVYDLSSILGPLLTHRISDAAALKGIKVAADGLRIFAVNLKAVKIWSVATGSLIGEFRLALDLNAGMIVAFAVSQCGRYLATGTTDGFVRIWQSHLNEFILLNSIEFQGSLAASSPTDSNVRDDSDGSTPGYFFRDLRFNKTDEELGVVLPDGRFVTVQSPTSLKKLSERIVKDPTGFVSQLTGLEMTEDYRIKVRHRNRLRKLLDE